MASAEMELVARGGTLLEAARFAFVFGSFGTPDFRDQSDLGLVDLRDAMGPPRERPVLTARPARKRRLQ